MLLKASRPQTKIFENLYVVHDEKTPGLTVVDYAMIPGELPIEHDKQKLSGCPKVSKRDHAVAEDYDKR